MVWFFSQMKEKKGHFTNKSEPSFDGIPYIPGTLPFLFSWKTSLLFGSVYALLYVGKYVGPLYEWAAARSLKLNTHFSIQKRASIRRISYKFWHDGFERRNAKIAERFLYMYVHM